MDPLVRTIIIVLLILFILGSFGGPFLWGWNGYYGGGLGAVLLIVLILILIGKI